MTIEQLLQKIESSDDILIVDTRKNAKTEFEVDHIKGAIPAPVDIIMAGEWVPPPSSEVVFY
jgi:rhodanese-related sulfurtransferase